MKKRSLLLLTALLFVSLTVYGCSHPAQQQEPPTETPIKITVTDAPSDAIVDESFSITWEIESGAKTIPHTATHYDYSSHAGSFGTDVAPGASGYTELTPDFAQGSFDIPNTFTVSIIPSENGALYYRAHAIVDGMQYWTDERIIPLIAKEVSQEEQEEMQAQATEFTIEADDKGFYMDGDKITEINVNNGDSVKITFNVRSGGVYFGGLDFRSKIWDDTGKVLPGESTTVEFTSSETFEVKSYWPASNKLKAVMKVIVS